MGDRQTVRDRIDNLRTGLKEKYRKQQDKRSDPELRQLNSLREAYGEPGGPELLIFGDSAMFWTTQVDTRRRHLADLLVDELGGGLQYEALVGPGYNPRVVSAFLSALDGARSKPDVVVVPTSVLMATHLFLQNPNFAYELESEAIRRAIATGSTETRGLPRPAQDAFEEYDRLPAPSLYGARRTAGELRLIVNATPQTAWQKAVRMRHLMDYYNAEKLTPDSPGIRLIGDLGRQLAEAGRASVAYIAPVNHAILKAMLGEDAPGHLAANAALIEQTFLEATGGSGQVANTAMACDREHFIDPVHLTYEGRVVLASHIADAVRSARTAAEGNARG